VRPPTKDYSLVLTHHRSTRRLTLATSAVAVAGLTAGLGVLHASADESSTAARRAPVAVAAGLGHGPSAPERIAAIHQTAAQKSVQREAAERRRKAEARRKAAARAAAARKAEQQRASRAASRAAYSGDPRGIARQIALSTYGWGGEQFSCLDALWQKESRWDHRAENPSSGAYGIPQALPGSKMAAFGGDWRTNPATQIEWGLDYIDGRYGSPCTAWSTAQSQGWY
jgi:hypothetical protein